MDSIGFRPSASVVLAVGALTAAVLAAAAEAVRPVVPPDTQLLVFAVGGSFSAIGLLCRTRLGAGGPGLLLGGFGMAWLVLLASASASGSPGFGGAPAGNLVAAALVHVLLSQLPRRVSGRAMPIAGYGVAVVAGGLMTGPLPARALGVAVVVAATVAGCVTVVIRLRRPDRAGIGPVLPVLVPGGAALLAYLAVEVTGLRGDPPAWLLHGLFGLLVITPVGFLITVACRTLARLRASRARVLAVADIERRRIERDLHDGVQQHLVSAAVLLDVLTRHLDSAADAAHTLSRVRTILADARVQLRHICHHAHPAALADDGLDAALTELAWQVPLPVELSGRAGPLPVPTAAAAYYVAAEALTNTIKHAAATRARIALARDATRLRITVADNGHGGADPARGTGLRGLADRVDAAGGRLAVRTGRTGGTVVEASLPCGS
ncbi:histidine kinase [Amycolatopsis sp. NPDC021455]|uniref:sensor histidine kinase n=1 Tax=Amycolatopsis sp. NPDC021455 TaxID=3154901 RepID=UPI0033C44A69